MSFIKERFPHTEIMMSFDGIGTHDWLRQHKGSEEQVRRSIAICKQAGLFVKINMNVNRKNRGVILDSVKMLNAEGANEIRIIKTTEAPRWQQNAKDASLSASEYYDFSVDFALNYKELGLELPVTIWQSLFIHGRNKSFHVLPVKDSGCDYDDKKKICSAMIYKISVQADGDIIPCAPLAGLFKQLGVELGNVKQDGLQKLLTKGPLIDAVMQTVGKKRNFSEKCGKCRFFTSCQGGCPAVSMLYGGDILSPDIYKCEFFEGGYYDKYVTALEGWRNLKPL